MKDHAREMDVVRHDIEVLRRQIDRALDNGATARNPDLLAAADLLYSKKKRLVELEAITLYRSRGSDAA